MKIFKKLFHFFKKEKPETYPKEFAIVVYNETALRTGISDLSNKIVLRYRYNPKTDKIEIYRTYGYSDSFVYNLKTKLKIPIYDQTEKEIKFPVFEEILLDEVAYDKG